MLKRPPRAVREINRFPRERVENIFVGHWRNCKKIKAIAITDLERLYPNNKIRNELR